MMNLLGNITIGNPAQEYAFIAAVILTVVLICWTFDLVVQLFKNFWK